MGLRCCRVKIEYSDSEKIKFYKSDNKVYILATCTICNNPILKHIEFEPESFEIVNIVRYNKITQKTKDLVQKLIEFEEVRIDVPISD